MAPVINLSPHFAAKVSPLELLQSTGTFMSRIPTKETLSRGGLIFHLADDNYFFAAAIQEQHFLVQRNDVTVAVDLTPLADSPELFLSFAWNPTVFYAFCGKPDSSEAPSISQATTQPICAPSSLVAWARKNLLLQAALYQTPNEFYARIISALSTLQPKIDEMNNINMFWNVQYEGNRIIRRTPKRETDVQPIISAFLSDLFIAANIEVIPEKESKNGALDYLFLGTLKSGDHVKFCVECKNGHSPDLVHGFETQLPTYMQNNGADRGAYCVFWYKGEWFDLPSSEWVSLTAQLLAAGLKSPFSNLRHVIVVQLDLTSRTAASRITV